MSIKHVNGWCKWHFLVTRLLHIIAPRCNGLPLSELNTNLTLILFRLVSYMFYHSQFLCWWCCIPTGCPRCHAGLPSSAFLLPRCVPFRLGHKSNGRYRNVPWVLLVGIPECRRRVQLQLGASSSRQWNVLPVQAQGGRSEASRYDQHIVLFTANELQHSMITRHASDPQSSSSSLKSLKLILTLQYDSLYSPYWQTRTQKCLYPVILTILFGTYTRRQFNGA